MPSSCLRALVSVWIAAVGISTGGCSSGDASSSSSGAGAASGSQAAGTGGAGGSSGGTNGGYVPPSCEQGCQDYLVATGLNRTIWFLWNQKLAGHPVGAQDVTGDCPLGGTVHITGMNSVSDDGVSSTVMAFELAACEASGNAYDLAFTGAVTIDGSFNAATDFAALTFTAPSLTVNGAVHFYDDPVIDETCDTNLTQQGMGDAFAMSGQRCGRTISESLLDPGTGSGGSAGSSQGGAGGAGGAGNTAGSGGSATDCACFCSDGSDCTDATDPNPCGVDADGIPDPCGCPVDCP